MKDQGHRRDLLGIFAHHKVAANLLMVILILSGLLALDRLNIQFFPTFELDLIRVRVIWTGASAEDVEDGITNPLEQRLRALDNLYRMTSTSAQGISSITLELLEGTDPLLALDQARRFVDNFRNLPQDAQKPEVSLVSRYEGVARVLIVGVADPRERRMLARRLERELLDRGIDRISLTGLPEELIRIEIPSDRLAELPMGLDGIGARIAAMSQDLPAGSLGQSESTQELRSLDKRRTALGFAQLSLAADTHTRLRLGDFAQIQREPQENSVYLKVDGKPAVELRLERTETGNSLEQARILRQWLADTQLPPGVSLLVYDESWQLLQERIFLLLKNGATGLLLVVAILYLFLTGRVAFWVAWGIPVSFLATLFILYLSGGSINMISLFGLIMALGIIVDDAIVVGEDALTHYQQGEAPLRAAEGGARRMLAPVLASSLTTVAAFLPLMLIGGRIGAILFAIPLVIVSVILASLIESFYVLPGHLRHAFLHTHGSSSLRSRLDSGFQTFRERYFRILATWAIHHRLLTLSIALSLLLLALGLLVGGRMKFTFFPTPEAQVITANATFVAGTPREQVDRFLLHLEETLRETERALDQGKFLRLVIALHGAKLSGHSGRSQAAGDQLGALRVELLPPDQRTVRNPTLIRAWRERIQEPAGLESLTISARRVGPPGRDLTIRLTGSDAQTLKAAALRLEAALSGLPGVREVEDDMTYGREQRIYRLTPAGEALGLDVAELGRQLRTAFDGQLIQIFQDGPDEVEVRVRLPRAERYRLGTLHRFQVRLPDGRSVPLDSVATWEMRQGFEVLRHAEGRLAVEVTADIDTHKTSLDEVLAGLEGSTLKALTREFPVEYSFEGRSADQRETLGDMRKGLFLGLALIYLILAWVFASYGWPLVVMAIIPFGLMGALFGHWLLGIDLTILSLFGLFGLSGIVINDSIILVSSYKRLREQGMEVNAALIEASCQRLRAVLLTSLTTIAGLLPLLFETSYQAQFLIPMATSIAFGLAFSTLLVLLVVPALLSLHESLHFRLQRAWRGLRGR